MRRLPVGAEALPDGGVHFRVWAPDRSGVAVRLETGSGASASVDLAPEDGGYFAGAVAEAGPGTLYRYRLDDDPAAYPDPASRCQPDGPHGPSQVIDPGRFPWTDADWRGLDRAGQVFYEMHVGTFTPEGTWSAAAAQLPALADVGVTAIELMPIAEFSGRFGWGYDGVDLFAPTQLYGTPDDARRFVDRAHACGLGVILDVVYNHLGPDGNHLKKFTAAYFTDRYANEWGEAINFDGPGAQGVREFFVANAGYWIDEFHCDGLRLDATQQIFDRSDRHILAEIAARVRAAAPGRKTYLVAENEPQDSRLLRPPEQGGHDLDAVWSDDFHHSAVVALTGHNPAYYSDHLGAPQEFVSAAKYGFLYQGQRHGWNNRNRGTPAFGIAPHRFVAYLQNHDQVANSGRARRVHERTSPGRLRAMTAWLLLGPATPMLFQGQEFASSAPFFYFADHKPEIAAEVRRGRAAFLAQFPALATPAMQRRLADPGAPETFERCKLDLAERESHAEAYNLHRDLLRLRRTDPVFARLGAAVVDGAVLGGEAFLLRWFGDAEDRLLLVNLGRDLRLEPAPEPLLAPPPGARWRVLWSSEEPRYGGGGTMPIVPDGVLTVPGHAALVLAPETASSTA